MITYAVFYCYNYLTHLFCSFWTPSEPFLDCILIRMRVFYTQHCFSDSAILDIKVFPACLFPAVCYIFLDRQGTPDILTIIVYSGSSQCSFCSCWNIFCILFVCSSIRGTEVILITEYFNQIIISIVLMHSKHPFSQTHSFLSGKMIC